MDTPTEVEVATLRADLAEARADVQRFEAQLDAANRELAQARAATDNARASGHEAAKSALDHYAMEKRNARTWEERALKAEDELAQARAERDRVYDDTERQRYDIWCLAEEYKDKWVRVDPKGVAEDIRDLLHANDRPPIIERQRRTIRALVVANRSSWWALRHMGGNQPFFVAMVRSNCAYFNRLGVTSEREITERERTEAKRSGQQAGE